MKRFRVTMFLSAALSTAAIFASSGTAQADTTGLSGTMAYSMDPARLSHALAEYGVTNLPSNYRASVMIDVSGMRMVSIAKKGDLGGNTMMLMSVENKDTLIAKGREMQAHGLPANMKAMATSNLMKSCVGNGSYDVQTVGEMVPVKVLSCNVPGHAKTVVESAMFMDFSHPVILVGTNPRGKFDEWAFKQLVTAVGSQ